MLKKILLVDDEEIILDSIGTDLRHENYNVTLASSGEKALPLLQKESFDLVITDLSMPGIDGIQVLKETKKINAQTCVIILTGYGDMTSTIDALRLGADDYLLKPCPPDELIIRISRCFEKQAIFQKLEMYESILPVCIHCQSIRDDSNAEPGKGQWFKMDHYFHTKSGKNISHGCCPACFEIHKHD